MSKRKSGLVLGLFITGLLSLNARAQYGSAHHTVLTNKNCSGQIGDLNCYRGIITKKAHELNVRDGFVIESDLEVNSINRSIYQGQKIIIDTHDRESCSEVKKTLLETEFQKTRQSVDLRELCNTDLKNRNDRYRSVTLMWETQEEYLTPLKLDFLKNTGKSVLTDTRNLTYLMVATMGLLWIGPESVSNWNKDEIREKGFFNKWKENVSNPPVMDHDAPLVNYVGHPVSGSAYYMIARTNGYSAMQSFGYSVVMSTFFWEYGFEAFAEKPSIQDLIITPVIGSLMGELLFNAYSDIKNNQGELLGSKQLGSVMMFILNPAGELSDSINKAMNKRFVQESTGNLVMRSGRDPVTRLPYSYIGVNLEFKF